MAITVNIPETATATLDEKDNITVSLQVQIVDGATVLGDKVITITVFLHTASILAYAVNMMVNEIEQFKALCIKQTQIRTALLNFTSQVIAAV